MKATRISFSQTLNQGKMDALEEIAERLGEVRAQVWREFGSINGLGVNQRTVRNQWMKDGTAKTFDVPARLWKESLRDSFGDIEAYRAAAKFSVKAAIRKRTKGDDERKRLYTALKYDYWEHDNFLHRQMRTHFRHGVTRVANQIVLDTDCYTTFTLGGRAWIDVMSLERGKRIAIPLKTTVEPSGTLRLILRDGVVEVHYTCDALDVCSTRPSGDATLGIDKGYTEVYTDSDGDRHGEGLGELLSGESDYLTEKYKRRNKLKAIAEKKTHKREAIYGNNFGRKKLNRRRKMHKQRVRDTVYQATHSVVDKAGDIVYEDLTSPINDKKKYGKNQSRRSLTNSVSAGWVKGTMAEVLDTVTKRRRSSLHIVNAAYTSQMDSRHGLLMGERRGDSFYCIDREVLDADTNAAQNILVRMYDTEITLYTPFTQVKAILSNRTDQRMGLLIQDTSCTEPI